jgi:hypothetical protein
MTCNVCMAAVHVTYTFAARFVQLMAHFSFTGLDLTLPGAKSRCTVLVVTNHMHAGVAAACTSDVTNPGPRTAFQARYYGYRGMYHECLVMWCLHTAYGARNVR